MVAALLWKTYMAAWIAIIKIAKSIPEPSTEGKGCESCYRHLPEASVPRATKKPVTWQYAELEGIGPRANDTSGKVKYQMALSKSLWMSSIMSLKIVSAT